MAKIPSASGRHGLSTIRQTRDEPRPLRSDRRVVEAWAIMLPPLMLGSERNRESSHRLLGVGLGELATVDLRHDLVSDDDGDAKLLLDRKRDVYLTSSARRIKVRRNLARCICRALSSPRPEKSVR
jgi:hypothetical protein